MDEILSTGKGRAPELILGENSYQVLRPRQLAIGSSLLIETDSESIYTLQVIKENESGFTLVGEAFRPYVPPEFACSPARVVISHNKPGLEVGSSFLLSDGTPTNHVKSIKASGVFPDDNNDQAARNLVQIMPAIPPDALKRIFQDITSVPNPADALKAYLASNLLDQLHWQIASVSLQLMRNILSPQVEIGLQELEEIVRVFANYGGDHNLFSPIKNDSNTRVVNFPMEDRDYQLYLRLTAQAQISNITLKSTPPQITHRVWFFIRSLLSEEIRDRSIHSPDKVGDWR